MGRIAQRAEANEKIPTWLSCGNWVPRSVDTLISRTIRSAEKPRLCVACKVRSHHFAWVQAGFRAPSAHNWALCNGRLFTYANELVKGFILAGQVP